MERSARIIIIIFLAMALGLGSFFAISAFRIIRAVEESQSGTTVSPFLSGESLRKFLPDLAIGAVSQDYADLAGDGEKELVIGYAIQSQVALSKRPSPYLRVYRQVDGFWRLFDEFSFPISEKPYANANDWQLISGAPSFERKDINGDGREELFIRLDIGSEFFKAVAIVAWDGGKLDWLPMTDKESAPMLPIFYEGGTTYESRRLILEHVSGARGLDILRAFGAFQTATNSARWSYDIFIEDAGGMYNFEPNLSAAYSASGRGPN